MYNSLKQAELQYRLKCKTYQLQVAESIIGQLQNNLNAMHDKIADLECHHWDDGTPEKALRIVLCKHCAYYNQRGCATGCGWCELYEHGAADECFCCWAESAKGATK